MGIAHRFYNKVVKVHESKLLSNTIDYSNLVKIYISKQEEQLMSRKKLLKKGIYILTAIFIVAVVASIINVNLGTFCFLAAFLYGLLYLGYIIYIFITISFNHINGNNNNKNISGSSKIQNAASSQKKIETDISADCRTAHKPENKTSVSINLKKPLPDSSREDVIVNHPNKKCDNSESHYCTQELFQDRHFHFEPLEGNVPQNIVKDFERVVEEANKLIGSHDKKQWAKGMLLVLDFPNTLPNPYKTFVSNYISSSMFGGAFSFNDPHFNSLHPYDFYGWRINETNQIFLIDLVNIGEKPKMQTLDESYVDCYKYISNNYSISSFLIESSVPGEKAQKELQSICKVAEGCGNLLLNKGYAYQCNYYFDITTHDTVRQEEVFKYLRDPFHLVSQFDYLYRNLTTSTCKWDHVNLDKLKSCGLGKQILNAYNLLLKKHYKQDSTNKKMYDSIFEKYEDFIISQINEKVDGHVYKSVGKRSKCVIVLTDITDDQFIIYKKRGLDVYHGFDVLRALGVWNQFLKYINP